MDVYGRWPGVVAICGDADFCCLPCARRCYGVAAIEALIEGTVHLDVQPIMQWQQGQLVQVSSVLVPGEGYPLDHEGNPLTMILRGSEDVRGMVCGSCGVSLDDDL